MCMLFTVSMNFAPAKTGITLRHLVMPVLSNVILPDVCGTEASLFFLTQFYCLSENQLSILMGSPLSIKYSWLYSSFSKHKNQIARDWDVFFLKKNLRFQDPPMCWKGVTRIMCTSHMYVTGGECNAA